MPDAIDDLLARPDVRRNPPASPELVEQIEQWYQNPLPEPLTRLWLASDGVGLDAVDAEIVSASWVLSLAGGDGWNWLFERGIVPLLDDHQGDYLHLIVREPLAYRVIFMARGDGTPYLRYRDLVTCSAGLIEALARREPAAAFLGRAEGDYPADAPRPVEDQIAARELLQADNQHEEWYYAAQLADETNYNTWEKLLTKPDTYLRDHVRRRLSQLHSPEIRDLLDLDPGR